MKRTVKLDPFFSDQPEKTFLSDFTRFLTVCKVAGSSFPLRIVKGAS